MPPISAILEVAPIRIRCAYLGLRGNYLQIKAIVYLIEPVFVEVNQPAAV